jgi:hypothetical protein
MTASGGAPGGGEYSLGTAVLRLYGDRSALDKELEVLRRYTERLEKQGVKVKFDADTGALTREVNGLQQMLNKAREAMQALSQGMQGDGSAFNGIAESLSKLGGGQGGAAGTAAAGLSGVAKAAGVAIPLLGQVGLAVMGLEGIFRGATGAINAFLGPFQQLAAESARFNQQVAQGGIFAANSFGIFGPDGKVVQGTANQMRAVRGVVTKEYGEIQKEVAKISGATAAEVYEGFNIILQNIDALGDKGSDLSNVTKLSTRIAAGMNTLGIPGQQLRSEVNSLLTGDIQMYDQLAQKLGISRDDAQQQQAAGTYYDFLMEKLNKLYDGQKVLAESLPNVQSNFSDLFQTISSQGGQAMERGLARGLQMVLTTLTSLQDSFTMLFRSISEAVEPILVIFGQLGAALTSVGSIVSSLLSMVITSLGTTLNMLGALLSGSIQSLVRGLEVIAKTIEVIAEAFNRGMRMATVFFRILGQQGNRDVDSQFDKLISGLDAFADWIEKNQRKMLEPWIALAQGIAQVRGQLQGLPQKDIDQKKAVIRSEFLSAFDTSDEYSLKPANLSKRSEQFVDELNQRLGSSQGSRNLEYAKQASKIKEEMYRNEIKALQQGVDLLQRQRQAVEAINQLSEARRNLTMQTFNLATQVAASPEGKAAAEGKRDDVALQQEQQRIRERVGLLATEKQMMEAQLEIQTRQIKIDQESLKIKRLEQEIEVNRARAASTELVQKLRNVEPGSAQQRTYQLAFQRTNKELEYRQQIMRSIDQSVSLAYEQEAVAQKIFGIDMQRLSTQEQILGVQAEAANYTREQQRLLAQIQAEELRIKNTLDEKVIAQKELQDAGNREIQQLQDERESQEALAKIEKSRAELGAVRAKAATEDAERVLNAAKGLDEARQGGGARELVEAQIRAAVAGVSATETATSAAERLYEAKERQMLQEQEVQRRAQQLQQERERSELRIAELNMRVELAKTQILLAQTAAARESLQLTGQRDELSRSVAGNAAVPSLSQGGAIGGSGVATAVAAARAAGFTGEQIPLMAAIAMAESSGRPTALNNNPATGDQSYGLWQINMLGGMGSERRRQFGISSNDQLYDPATNARAAKAIYDSQGLGAWSVYRSGAYRQYLPAAAAAMGAGGPDMPNAMGLQVGQAVPAGAGGPVPIGVTPFSGAQSIENDLSENTNQTQRLTQQLERIEQQIEVITGARSAQLETRSALDNERLEEGFAGQRRTAMLEEQSRREIARVLDNPRGRLAVSTADSVTNAVRSGVGGAANTLISGGDPREALKQALQGLASEVLNTTLKSLLDPLLAQLNQAIIKAITGWDPAIGQQMVAASNLNAAAAALMAAAKVNFSGQPLQGADLIGGIFGGQNAGFGMGLTNAIDYSGAFTSAATGMGGGGGLFGAGLSVVGSLLPGLASGGDVEEGRAYRVGEFGPETIIAGSDGKVVPTEMSVPWMKAGRSGAGRALADGRRVSPGSPATAGMPAVPFRRGAAAAAAAAGFRGGATATAQDEFSSSSGGSDGLEVPFLRAQGGAGGPAGEGGVMELLATLGGSPIRVESESFSLGDLDVVTSAQHQKGMQTASDQAFYRIVEGLLNNVQLRKKLGVG